MGQKALATSAMSDMVALWAIPFDAQRKYWFKLFMHRLYFPRKHGNAQFSCRECWPSTIPPSISEPQASYSQTQLKSLHWGIRPWTQA